MLFIRESSHKNKSGMKKLAFLRAFYVGKLVPISYLNLKLQIQQAVIDLSNFFVAS